MTIHYLTKLRLPLMLKDLLIDALEKIVNQYLHCDPDYPHFLSPLENKTTHLKILQPPLNFYCIFSADSIQFLQDPCEEFDCIITGTSFRFLKLALEKEPDLSAPGIELQGDTQVAQDFAILCHGIQIDWEEILSKIIGDTLAHMAGNTARKAINAGKRLAEKTQVDLSEYLHHESNALPTRLEVNNFLDKIDTLRHNVARIEARVNQLKNQRR